MNTRTLLLCALAFLLTACDANTTGALPTLTPAREAPSATVAAPAPTAVPTPPPTTEPAGPTTAPTAALPVAETVIPATAAPAAAATTVASAVAATPVAAADDTPLLDVASAAPTAAPSPAGAAAAASDPVRVVIGTIGMDRPLVSVGLDGQRRPIVPMHDAAWYNLSAQPGQGENVVLWGHVLRFKSAPKIAAPFARVKELGAGAAITLYTADGAAHVYRVQRQVWATPDQVEYILPRGAEQLTLVSCIGDKVILDGGVEMTNRLVTIAVPE